MNLEPVRVLCVCQYGHSRSVALARELHSRGVAAVACGVATAGSALPTLAEWATVVALLDDALRGSIPASAASKLMSFHVGPDRWVNPYNAELRSILADMVDAKLGTIVGPRKQ